MAIRTQCQCGRCAKQWWLDEAEPDAQLWLVKIGCECRSHGKSLFPSSASGASSSSGWAGELCRQCMIDLKILRHGSEVPRQPEKTEKLTLEDVIRELIREELS